MLYANTTNVIITNIYSTNENDNYYINMNAKVKIYTTFKISMKDVLFDYCSTYSNINDV